MNSMISSTKEITSQNNGEFNHRENREVRVVTNAVLLYLQCKFTSEFAYSVARQNCIFGELWQSGGLIRVRFLVSQGLWCAR